MSKLLVWGIGYACGIWTVLLALWWLRRAPGMGENHGKVSQTHLNDLKVRSD